MGYGAKELSRAKELLKKGMKKKEDNTIRNIYVLLSNIHTAEETQLTPDCGDAQTS